MKKKAIIGLIVVLIATVATVAFTKANETTPQTLCPVGGSKIDKSTYVDADGKRIYLCCTGCSAKVKADPAKYIAQLEKQGITLDKATVPQTVCPVMGSKINKSLYVDANGKRIYMCCAGCTDKIKANAAKYIAQLENQGITLDKATVPQTVCPVMGGKINKSLYVDANGKRIYMCCTGCTEKIKANAEKYIAQFEKQGVTLETIPREDTKEIK
ncbi:hypothetical protein ACFL47_01880 [Candidatus Latescibacterota bacterium]